MGLSEHELRKVLRHLGMLEKLAQARAIELDRAGAGAAQDGSFIESFEFHWEQYKRVVGDPNADSGD